MLEWACTMQTGGLEAMQRIVNGNAVLELRGGKMAGPTDFNDVNSELSHALSGTSLPPCSSITTTIGESPLADTPLSVLLVVARTHTAADALLISIPAHKHARIRTEIHECFVGAKPRENRNDCGMGAPTSLAESSNDALGVECGGSSPRRTHSCRAAALFGRQKDLVFRE